MKNYYDSDKKCYIALDGEEEYDTGMFFFELQSWRRSYCRKNSKREMKVILRCCHSAPQPDFWIYYYELHVNNKILSKSRLIQQAYQTLARDKPKQDYPGVELVTYFTFTPAILNKSI